MLFAVYLALLVWIVLFKLELPHVGLGELRVVKLVPFVSDGVNGPSALSEVVANLLLFMPFGVYLGVLAPSWSWPRAAGVFAATSVALEGAQYVLRLGSTDVTDVIMNTAGGLVGLGLFATLRRVLRERTGRALRPVFAIGTVLAVLASILFFLSPLHYAQRDVVVPVGQGPAHSSFAAEPADPTDGRAADPR